MLQLKNICKSYTTADFTQTALNDVSVAFRDSEFVAILGPSGSGKTTMLNIIGGLDHYDSGDLIIDGVSTKEYKDHDWDTYRNNRVGFVFQSYNLIPHQTITENVELALTLSGVGRAERRQRAEEALRKVGLGDHLKKKPSQLSGGQMQRVAIARALINDPEILLADEPTGALDSKTSVQIMDILSDIAKDRLVVMVTHNPDLAEQYANRIVSLTDGVITSDTHPYKAKKKKRSAKPVRRTSMSFATALSLSARNLMTKKGRTFMTSFAGSIGIIGIAAILALANGVNSYIADIEEETLSEYPLSVTSQGFDMTSLMASAMGVSVTDVSDDDEDSDSSGVVTEIKIMNSMFGSISNNDLSALKEYLESGESGIEEYVSAIEYTYDVTPLIYSSDTSDGVRQVNPDTTFSSLGISSTSTTSSLLSSMVSTDIFYQLPTTSSLYEDQYEVVAGRWPEAYNEVVIVLSSGGRISDFMLYVMGLRDYSELEAMVAQFSESSEITVSDDYLEFTYDDLMAVTFKLVNACDLYVYDEEYGVWIDKSEDEDYMLELVENGETLYVVGIVQPDEDATVTSLSTGIYYTQDLIVYLSEQAEASQIVQDQLDNPSVNVFTGEEFGSDEDSSFDMDSLFTIDTDALVEAFSIDESVLQAALSGVSLDLDLSDVSIDSSALSNIDLSSVSIDTSSIDLSDISIDLSDLSLSLDGVTASVDSAALASATESIMSGFESWYAENADNYTTEVDYSSILAEALTAYLSSDEVASALAEALASAVDTSGVTVDTDALSSAMEGVMSGFSSWYTENYGDTSSALTEYLATSDAQSALAELLTSASDSEALMEAMSDVLSGYSSWYSENYGDVSSAFSEYFATDAVQTALAEALASAVDTSAITVDSDALASAMESVMGGFAEWFAENYGDALSGGSSMSEALADYMASDEVASALSAAIAASIDTSSLEETIATQVQEQVGSALSEQVVPQIVAILTEQIYTQLASAMQSAMESALEQTMAAMTAEITSQVTEAMAEYTEAITDALSSAMSIDTEAFADAFTMNMDEDELTELIMALMTSSDTSYTSNLSTLGYVDWDSPSQIDIYSISFEAKESVTDILDAYNDAMEAAGEDDKVVSYTDLVGTLMSSVTTIINMISYVLTAFVSISLVVSSIMIGIITYISVLERKKEIGILRSIGASKGDIANVFNAETIIVGLCAGLIGIGITLLASVIVNPIVYYFTDVPNVMILPWQAAVALVGISVGLTFIAGLIPSSAASRKDPVEALRSE